MKRRFVVGVCIAVAIFLSGCGTSAIRPSPVPPTLGHVNAQTPTNCSDFYCWSQTNINVINSNVQSIIRIVPRIANYNAASEQNLEYRNTERMLNLQINPAYLQSIPLNRIEGLCIQACDKIRLLPLKVNGVDNRIVMAIDSRSIPEPCMVFRKSELTYFGVVYPDSQANQHVCGAAIVLHLSTPPVPGTSI